MINHAENQMRRLLSTDGSERSSAMSQGVGGRASQGGQHGLLLVLSVTAVASAAVAGGLAWIILSRQQQQEPLRKESRRGKHPEQASQGGPPRAPGSGAAGRVALPTVPDAEAPLPGPALRRFPGLKTGISRPHDCLDSISSGHWASVSSPFQQKSAAASAAAAGNACGQAASGLDSMSRTGGPGTPAAFNLQPPGTAEQGQLLRKQQLQGVRRQEQEQEQQRQQQQQPYQAACPLSGAQGPNGEQPAWRLPAQQRQQGQHRIVTPFSGAPDPNSSSTPTPQPDPEDCLDTTSRSCGLVSHGGGSEAGGGIPGSASTRSSIRTASAPLGSDK